MCLPRTVAPCVHCRPTFAQRIETLRHGNLAMGAELPGCPPGQPPNRDIHAGLPERPHAPGHNRFRQFYSLSLSLSLSVSLPPSHQITPNSSWYLT